MATNTEGQSGRADRESALVEVEGVSKSFRNVEALKDVSLRVDRNEVLGIVGENGAGKSTLLNILTGVMQPDAGHIRIGGEEVRLDSPRDAAEKGISLVPQELEVTGNLRGFEYLFLGREDEYARFGILNKDRMKADARERVEELGLSIDVTDLVSSYSFGEKQMLEIARGFDRATGSTRPTILLDEPVAGLEEAHRDLLFERIEDLRDRATFVFVSHELDVVRDVCDRIYVLKDGGVVTELAADDTDNDELQELMVGRERSDEYYRTSDQLGDDELGEVVMSVEDLRYGEEFGPVSLSVREGEIFGVAGVDGSGKEELGRLLAGDLTPDSGRITVDGETVADWSRSKAVGFDIGYVPKDRRADGILPFKSVKKNASLAMVGGMNGNLPLLDKGAETEATDEMIDQLQVKTPGAETPIQQLSGGNQQKVVLGRWLVVDTPILVMDNATRGIDVGAKEEIYELCRELTADGTSIIFIGDELPEIIGMANRIGVMKDNQLVDVLEAPAEEKPTEEDVIRRMV